MYSSFCKSQSCLTFWNFHKLQVKEKIKKKECIVKNWMQKMVIMINYALQSYDIIWFSSLLYFAKLYNQNILSSRGQKCSLIYNS